MRQNPGPAEVGEQITKIAKSARILAVAMVRASSEAMEAINRGLDRAALKEAVAAAVQARPGEEARRVEEAYKQSLPYALSPFKLQRELAALAVAARTATPSIAVVERGHGPAPAKAVKKLAEMASDDFAKIVGRPPDYKKKGYQPFLYKISAATGIKVSAETIQNAVESWEARHPETRHPDV